MKEIYYARHVHDWEVNGIIGSSIKYLFDNKAIAIRFEDIESWKKDDYTKKRNQGPSAIEYMNTLNAGKNDAYIFSSYKIGGEHRVLLGKPKVGSKCFLSQHLVCRPGNKSYNQECLRVLRGSWSSDAAARPQ